MCAGTDDAGGKNGMLGHGLFKRGNAGAPCGLETCGLVANAALPWCPRLGILTGATLGH